MKYFYSIENSNGEWYSGDFMPINRYEGITVEQKWTKNINDAMHFGSHAQANSYITLLLDGVYRVTKHEIIHNNPTTYEPLPSDDQIRQTYKGGPGIDVGSAIVGAKWMRCLAEEKMRQVAIGFAKFCIQQLKNCAAGKEYAKGDWHEQYNIYIEQLKPKK